MASNYNQSQEIINGPLDDPLNIITSTTANEQQHQQHLEAQIIADGGGGRPERRPININDSNGFNLAPTSINKILNDAHLIRSRRINFNQKARKDLELMCEDKVSRYKLEEVHSSLPSSNKSTFIMTFSPDGQRVASTHGDHRIYICDLNTGKLIDTLEGHPKTPWCLAWHPSNREILASGCLAGEVRVWDLRSKACESWTSENNTIIASLDFHPKERVLVIATSNDIHFWDWSESEPFAKATTTYDKEKVKFVEFDSSGTKLITGISNLPKFPGYNSESLQNRIIDSYITQNSMDQLPAATPATENMTQNSEITVPETSGGGNNINNSNGSSFNSNESFIERMANYQHQLNLSRQSTSDASSNEQDINYRSTLTLSRVAFLYRQLEALEDSMRTTTFSPYIGSRQINMSPIVNQPTVSNLQDANTNNNNNDQSNNRETNHHHQQPPPTQQATSQDSSNSSSFDQTSQTTTDSHQSRTEPFVVSFDESLENLHLAPLVVDGQTFNPASVVEQYPIDSPHQLHFMMQFESLNQVNQNFIRISKLMSSVRLYRQIVQQILSSNSGQGHYQANQILTAQSVSSRSSRHTSNLPIVFRNFPIGTQGGSVATIEPNNINNNFSRAIRSTDPILAIQFRNSARNVPLATICKIELLSARSACMKRSQLLIEQNVSDLRATSSIIDQSLPVDVDISGGRGGGDNNNLSDETNNGQQDTSLSLETTADDQITGNNAASSSAPSINDTANPIFYPLLHQLHITLTIINNAPLTTSNVHTHITSLRSLINKILNAVSSMFETQNESRRLSGLIHDIADSLTGRSWNIPLGATLDDIRLDVIHTLCIVDLTLHLMRQVQLLQLQRLSAVARIEDSRRTNATISPSSAPTNDGASSANAVTQSDDLSSLGSTPMEASQMSTSGTDMANEPSTSHDDGAVSANKRKEIDSIVMPVATTSTIQSVRSEEAKGAKKRRIDSGSKDLTSNSEEGSKFFGTEMIEPRHNSSMPPSVNHDDNVIAATSISRSPLSSSDQRNLPTTTMTSGGMLPTEPASALMSPGSILVWNNNAQSLGVEQSMHRFLVAATANMSSNHILVRIAHRSHGTAALPANVVVAPPESRRRALSQDNSSGSVTSTATSSVMGTSAQETSSSSNINIGADHQQGSNRSSGVGYGNEAGRQTNHPSPGVSGGGAGLNNGPAFEAWPRHPHLHVYQTRGTGQHLWFNQFTIPLPISNANFRLQCWNFSLSAIPNIKDSQSNIVTRKCRIYSDASVDISSDGGVIACLVPRDDGSCIPSFDLKVFSLKSYDFGTCYYQVAHGPNAISVSLSPSACYAVVGLASNKFISNDANDDDVTIAKVFKISGMQSSGYVRDIKIKRDDAALTLNAIRWMARGIVYNVGPQHHQRYQATRMRNRVA